jgi:hypothetical protein
MKRLVVLLSCLLAAPFGMAQSISQPAAPRNIVFTYSAAAGAWAVTLSANASAGEVSHIIIANAGETSASITLPPSPIADAQIDCISNNVATLTTVTYIANAGQSIGGVVLTAASQNPPTLGNSRVCWQWMLGTTTWMRLQ